MTLPISSPDLSTRPFQLVAERPMEAPPSVLFRAWTEQIGSGNRRHCRIRASWQRNGYPSDASWHSRRRVTEAA